MIGLLDSVTKKLTAWLGTAGAANVLPKGRAPSSYSALKSATTTVTGQSEAIPTGATGIRVTNLDATNYGLIAFGTSAANAESNAANGEIIPKTTTDRFDVPSNATHLAWLGNTGTVSLSITYEA